MAGSYPTKKLLNNIRDCVHEALQGLVAVHPGLCMLDTYPIVIREDIQDVKDAGKVTLLSGGGSGHEPSHAGFVGRGMLSAAVAGAVFASPPTQNILAAIRAIGHGNPAGTLLIVKNYTGDRLNFGIAAERAKAEGLKVAMVIIGEDCAIMSPDKAAQRRGLCGTILVHKIAGAMAEEGESLERIKGVADKLIQSLGTMGVCLYPCSVPGAGHSFTLGAGEVEVGLGIHGEAGVKRQQLSQAKELVDSMVKSVMTSLGDTLSVVVIINNLGGTSNLELTLAGKCAIDSLKASGMKVLRAYCGTFMTSLEMAGISITCMKVDPASNILQYLDKETTAPAWPRTCVSKVSGYERNDSPPIKLEKYKKYKETIPKGAEAEVPLSAEVQKSVLAALSGACSALIMKESELNELDSGCGDGDCGSTLRRGADGVVEWLVSVIAERFSAHQIAVHLAHISESKMGGSSGALYSIFFLAVATELRTGQTYTDLTRAVGSGMAAISAYGGASVGDRTMLDALGAIQSSLLMASSETTIKQTLTAAAQAAEEATEKTSTMRAQAGRASYVNTELTKGKIDAGAAAVACWMSAVAHTFK